MVECDGMVMAYCHERGCTGLSSCPRSKLVDSKYKKWIDVVGDAKEHDECCEGDSKEENNDRKSLHNTTPACGFDDDLSRASQQCFRRY